MKIYEIKNACIISKLWILQTASGMKEGGEIETDLNGLK